MSSISSCFGTEAMYSPQRCDKDDSASSDHASPNISGSYSSNYTWVKVACDESHPIPSCRSKHAVAVHNGYIYLYGGRDGNIGHKDLWCFEIASNKWERMTCTGDRPFLLQDHTMIAYNGKLYVFGGEFSASWSREAPLWCLDLAQKKWTKSVVKSDVSVPCGRRSHTAVITNHQMHIYGGLIDLKGSTGELWTYDLDDEMWHLAYRPGSSSDDCPVPRHSHSAIVHDSAMWVYGGMADLTPRSDLWCWHFKRRKWTKVKNKNGPPALAGHSACKVPRGMVLYGGESSGVIQGDLWRYTFFTQTWQKLTCDGLTPFPRTQHCTLVLPSFMLQQAWLAAGNDRSLSVPLLKQKPGLLEESHRPWSSPAGSHGSNASHSSRNSVAPYNQQIQLSIEGPGRLAQTAGATANPLEDTKSLIKQVTDKLGKLSRSTDTVQVLRVEDQPNDRVLERNNERITERNNLSEEAKDMHVQSRVEEVRTHIRQMRNTKNIDSVSLCRLLSTGSESSEEWLAYDNCMSLESSGHFSRLNSVTEEARPLKRPKSHSVNDTDELYVSPKFKSASVESILSMSHNPKLPPPYWLSYKERPRPDLTTDTMINTFKSRSWDSLLKSFGGVGMSCVDISTDPHAVELTSLCHSDLIIEDLEDCDMDQLDITPVPGSPSKSSPKHISIPIGREPCGASIAWTETDLCEQPNEDLPDLLADVPSDDPITAYYRMTTRQEKQKDSPKQTGSYGESFQHKKRQKEEKIGSNIELTNFSRKDSQTGFPPGTVLRKYLSHMGVRTCDTVHIYIFGGKESESCNIGIKPLPVWRLDVCELSSGKNRTESRRK